MVDNNDTPLPSWYTSPVTQTKQQSSGPCVSVETEILEGPDRDSNRDRGWSNRTFLGSRTAKSESAEVPSDSYRVDRDPCSFSVVVGHGRPALTYTFPTTSGYSLPSLLVRPSVHFPVSRGSSCHLFRPPAAERETTGFTGTVSFPNIFRVVGPFIS